MMRHYSVLCLALLSLCVGAIPVSAPSQTPDILPLLTGHKIVCAQYGSGLIYAGLEKGGLVEWDPAAARALRILTRRDGLGGHRVTDLAWIGTRLWVATMDGGLTVISEPGAANESMRIYSSLLASLGVTAVTGHVVGGIERIYYGTHLHGIGVITGGLPGAYYTVQNGLISNSVIDLALAGNVLLIATPAGLSRFAENTFTNYGLSISDRVNALDIGPDGNIWAATASGVKRWNDETRTLDPVFETADVVDLAVDGESVWALASNHVFRIQGGNIEQQFLPAEPEGQQVVIEALTAGHGHAWVAGLMRPAGLAGFEASRALLALAGDVQSPYHILPTCQVGAPGFCGVAFDSHGRAWLGDFRGDGLAGWDGDRWYNVTQLATAENDSNGLFNHTGDIWVMARSGDAIWFTQAGTGVIRFRPAAEPGDQEEWDLVRPENSGIRGKFFVAIGAHPDGPVFFCTNDWDGYHRTLGVDVLIDPENWRQPSSWLHIGPERLAGGNNVWAVGFERRDIVWFAVRGVGLQRWDINGPDAGPDDPLTWDTSENNWLDQPLNRLSGSNIMLEGTNAIVPGPDGSLWAGGTGGLVNFRFQPPHHAIWHGDWLEKTLPNVPGLLASRIVGLQLDHNNDLWAMTADGLNRLRLGTQPLIIDAFTDLQTYLRLNTSLYSLGVVSALPGPTYHHLAMSADGTQLALSSSWGGALVSIPAVGAGDDGLADRLNAAYLYPNPFPGPTGDPRLGLGGLVPDGHELLSLEILNLAGQVVHVLGNAARWDDLWDGRNREGRRVAAGLYMVKITLAGRTVVKPLAVAY